MDFPLNIRLGLVYGV